MKNIRVVILWEENKMGWFSKKKMGMTKKQCLVIEIVKERIKHSSNQSIEHKYQDYKEGDIFYLDTPYLFDLPEASMLFILDAYWYNKYKGEQNDERNFQKIVNERASAGFPSESGDKGMSLKSFVKYRIRIEDDAYSEEYISDEELDYAFDYLNKKCKEHFSL